MEIVWKCDSYYMCNIPYEEKDDFFGKVMGK